MVNTKLIIRWLFLVLLLGFLYLMSRMNMLFRNQDLFLILLFIVSGVSVLGVIFFRDGVMEDDDNEDDAQ